jgi:hypothetical protein
MVRAGLVRLLRTPARRLGLRSLGLHSLGLRRRSRVAPGPLRVVDRRTGPSAVGGALFGGFLALAVLAAFSLPLVFSHGPAPDAQAEAEIAYVGAASDEAPLARSEVPAPVRAAAAEPARAAAERAAPAFDLPVLENAAVDLEAEAPPVAAPVPPKPAARKAARKASANEARAATP